VRQVTKRFGRAEAVDPDPVRLHAVRKAVKRARYAAEAAPNDPDAQLDVQRFERLQEVLGRHQDLALAAEYLRSAAATDPTLDTRQVAQELAHWIADLDARALATAREAFVVAAATGTFPTPDRLDESA
jgi:CHAD domain-containing protein